MATAAFDQHLSAVIPASLQMHSEDATFVVPEVPSKGQRGKVVEVTARPFRVPLTGCPLKRGSNDATASVQMRVVDRSGELLGSVINIRLQKSDKYAEFERITNRVMLLSAMEDGWKGPGSKGPSVNARRDALALLRKIIGLSNDLNMPGIGLDEEGIYTLSWLEPDRSGCISVYGDGTYSFFMKSGALPISSDEESIGRPLHSGLVAALLS